MPAMSWTIKIHFNLISSVLHFFVILPFTKKWFKPYQMPWKGVFTSAAKLENNKINPLVSLPKNVLKTIYPYLDLALKYTFQINNFF